MSLDISFERQTGVTWHVGQPSPVHYSNVKYVDEVQADGDDLGQ